MSVLTSFIQNFSFPIFYSCHPCYFRNLNFFETFYIHTSHLEAKVMSYNFEKVRTFINCVGILIKPGQLRPMQWFAKLFEIKLRTRA